MIWVEPGVLVRSYQPDLFLLKRYKEEYGIKSVINLRQESELSKDLCLALDLEYYYIPVIDMGLPSKGQVDHFFNILKMCGGPALIHCYAGIGRTGVFCALYRIANGCDSEEAIRLTDLEAAQHVKLLDQQANFIRQYK